jgi:stage V sporulation protein B
MSNITYNQKLLLKNTKFIYFIMIKKIMNNKFLLTTLILLTGGFISKFLGFIIKIIITREMGTEGIGLYSLLAPTYSLFTTIAIFSYPTAISRLISIKGKSSKKIIFSVIPISLTLNTLVIILLCLFAPLLSEVLLKEPRLYYPIICVGLTMPFVGLSCILKGYFWGKQKMLPYIISNITEQVIRLIVIIVTIPDLVRQSITLAISYIVLINIISESASILVMVKAIPKDSVITLKDLKPHRDEIKEVMNISIPTTSSKIIGSFAYFLEPIVLTNVLLFLGYNSNYIINEYGILNGYAMSLLLLPHFFTQSVSTALIPEVSKNYSENNIKLCKRRIKQVILISFAIGFISTLVIYIFPEQILRLIFNTTEGVKYIKILAPFTLLYFIEIPLIHALQALNKAKFNMFITILGSIIRLGCILLFSLFHLGMYAMVISIIITLIFSTYFNYLGVKRTLG